MKGGEGKGGGNRVRRAGERGGGWKEGKKRREEGEGCGRGREERRRRRRIRGGGSRRRREQGVGSRGREHPELPPHDHPFPPPSPSPTKANRKPSHARLDTTRAWRFRGANPCRCIDYNFILSRSETAGFVVLTCVLARPEP